MVTYCDWHPCAQCNVIKDDEHQTPTDFDSTFVAFTKWTTRGYRVNFTIDGIPNLNDWPPSYAREIARRLLDAADLAETQDWNAQTAEPHRDDCSSLRGGSWCNCPRNPFYEGPR